MIAYVILRHLFSFVVVFRRWALVWRTSITPFGTPITTMKVPLLFLSFLCFCRLFYSSFLYSVSLYSSFLLFSPHPTSLLISFLLCPSSLLIRLLISLVLLAACAWLLGDRDEPVEDAQDEDQDDGNDGKRSKRGEEM